MSHLEKYLQYFFLDSKMEMKFIYVMYCDIISILNILEQSWLELKTGLNLDKYFH